VPVLLYKLYGARTILNTIIQSLTPHNNMLNMSLVKHSVTLSGPAPATMTLPLEISQCWQVWWWLAFCGVVYYTASATGDWFILICDFSRVGMIYAGNRTKKTVFFIMKVIQFVK